MSVLQDDMLTFWSRFFADRVRPMLGDWSHVRRYLEVADYLDEHAIHYD